MKMLTLCASFKNVRHRKYLISLSKSLPINILPSFKKLTLNTNYFLTSTKHLISARGPKIWNKFLTKEEKKIQSHSTFLRNIKARLPERDNERNYF